MTARVPGSLFSQALKRTTASELASIPTIVSESEVIIKRAVEKVPDNPNKQAYYVAKSGNLEAFKEFLNREHRAVSAWYMVKGAARAPGVSGKTIIDYLIDSKFVNPRVMPMVVASGNKDLFLAIVADNNGSVDPYGSEVLTAYASQLLDSRGRRYGGRYGFTYALSVAASESCADNRLVEDLLESGASSWQLLGFDDSDHIPKEIADDIFPYISPEQYEEAILPLRYSINLGYLNLADYVTQGTVTQNVTEISSEVRRQIIGATSNVEMDYERILGSLLYSSVLQLSGMAAEVRDMKLAIMFTALKGFAVNIVEAVIDSYESDQDMKNFLLYSAINIISNMKRQGEYTGLMERRLFEKYELTIPNSSLRENENLGLVQKVPSEFSRSSLGRVESPVMFGTVSPRAASPVEFGTIQPVGRIISPQVSPRAALPALPALFRRNE